MESILYSREEISLIQRGNWAHMYWAVNFRSFQDLTLIQAYSYNQIIFIILILIHLGCQSWISHFALQKKLKYVGIVIFSNTYEPHLLLQVIYQIA